MANLPEKNITQVDEITSVPANSKLFVNANGEFRQATVNEVVKSSTVVTSAVENAINTAVEDGVNSHFKQTTGSPILLTDTADGTLIDFKGKGRSTQNGTPTPDSPIEIKSVADGGYFDGELLQGYYSSTGAFASTGNYVCTKNKIPCVAGDEIKLKYKESASTLSIMFFDENGAVVTFENFSNVSEAIKTAPTNATSFTFTIGNTAITPQTAKHIAVTINGKYALIVKSVGAYEGELAQGYYSISNNGQFVSSNGARSNLNPIRCNSGDMVTVKANCENVSSIRVLFFTNSGSFISGGNNDNTNEITLIAPTNASYYHFSILTTNAIEYIFVGLNAIKYIPLNEPLRSSLDGSVSDVASLTEVNRKFTEDIFDGSESWVLFSTNTFEISVVSAKGNGNAVCSHYKYSTDGANNTFYIRPSGTITFVDTTCATLAEWKAKLQANPIKVIYELAEPVVETIESVDITTYNNVTYLTASDNAEMELEYPTSKVAGIASIGYSKGIKAEYETEQLKKQLLEIQATIVNTL